MKMLIIHISYFNIVSNNISVDCKNVFIIHNDKQMFNNPNLVSNVITKYVYNLI